MSASDSTNTANERNPANSSNSADPDAKFKVGLLIFENVTQLDFTGPYEVFARMSDCSVSLVAREMHPVRTEHGLTVLPEIDFAAAPAFDLICVPGGRGVNALLDDAATLEFLRAQSRTARYVTSVCTGALALGAAGLLHGYRATTHWLSIPFLERFGAHPVEERVVIDRNRITGGGITAGIDMALRVAARHRGEEEARRIQLMMEYNPAPPFAAGHPTLAEEETVQAVRLANEAALEDRARIIGAVVDSGDLRE